MRRRTFIAGLLVATAAGCAHAQQPAKLPTIGFLGTTTPSVWKDYVPAFVQRLRELGWVEGRTVAIEYRWAEGRNERFGEIAAEFARLKVDVIVTSGGAHQIVGYWSGDHRSRRGDEDEQHCYSHSWRIALLERFWQARHPPRYAAYLTPSSPRFRLSSAK